MLEFSEKIVCEDEDHCSLDCDHLHVFKARRTCPGIIEGIGRANCKKYREYQDLELKDKKLSILRLDDCKEKFNGTK